MQYFSSLKRQELIDKVISVEYDLAIIGGGITGAGIALDAASRGIKTVLIDKNDFASGTSSRSTKLVHGGLRYLKQFEIGLVMEVGRERRIVHDLAPHLVVSEKMLLPFFKGGTFGKFSTALGLWVYDFLAGVRRKDRRKMLSKLKTLEIEPLLPPETLKGSGLYAEYRTDDARLTVEIIKTAINHGADCLNYMEATGFLYSDNRIAGIQIKDNVSGRLYNIPAKYVVNACGPWVDELRGINKSKQGKTLHLTKGVHVVVPHKKFPVKHSIYFDVPDGRMIFAIPRGNVTYIGTTDTDFFSEKDHLTTDRKDAAYLLDSVNFAFPSLNLLMEDISSSWAGLRPLINQSGKKTSEISRKDEIFISDTGLISIAGGKLTGYRKMSQKIADIVSRKLKKEYYIPSGKCLTHRIKLSGNTFDGESDVTEYTKQVAERILKFSLTGTEAVYLVHNYGHQSDEILSRLQKINENDPALKLLKAELYYTVEHEMTLSATDFFIRRTGRLFFDMENVKKYADPILREMRILLLWNLNRTEEEKRRLEAEIYHATHFE